MTAPNKPNDDWNEDMEHDNALFDTIPKLNDTELEDCMFKLRAFDQRELEENGTHDFVLDDYHATQQLKAFLSQREAEARIEGKREMVDKLKDPKVAKKVYDLAVKLEKVTENYHANQQFFKEFSIPIKLQPKKESK